MLACFIAHQPDSTLQVQVEVQAANLPILEGIQQCLQAGVTSSLHAQNSRIVSAMADVEQAAQHALWPLLCDPQTGMSSSPFQCC